MSAGGEGARPGSGDPPGPIRFYSKLEAYHEFSNFAPYGFEADGVYWPTVEHYFQAEKFPDHPDHREKIRLARTPSEAKSRGRSRTIPIRHDWEEVKEEVMRRALHAKFTTHPALRDLLLATGDRELVEVAPMDHYWGIGRSGSGRNRLGVLLMAVRDELRDQPSADGGSDRPDLA